MKTSASGRKLIEQREGRRLSAYRDTRGILTIGVGHTGRMSPPPVTAGMMIDAAECDAMLAADLVPVEATIATHVTVPVGQNEFDALASLGFNIGVGGLARSRVVRRLNAGDVEGAGAAFMDWCKPTGLTGRREAERKQFLTPDAPDMSGISPSHAVTKTRAATIVAKARLANEHATTTTVGAGAVVGAGTVTTIAVHATHHGDVAIILGTLVAVGAALDALVAWSRRATAKSLTRNAAAQAAVAASLEPSPIAPTSPTPAPIKA